MAQQESINDKIVHFCKDHFKKTVGDGECFALAAAAVQAADGRPPSQPESGSKAGPGWGELVYALDMTGPKRKETKVAGKRIRPGNVIQLGDAKFAGSNYFMVFPQHSAVVVGVKEGGRVLVVDEQNTGGKRFVTQGQYRLNDLKTGWLRVYQVVAK